MFLKNESWVSGLRDDVFAFECEFDASRYDDSLYSALSVPFPSGLSRAVTKRRAEFLAGRYCAGRALLSLGAAVTEIGFDDKRCPLWPAGMHGSITHCDDRALAAVTSTPGTLGIDLEPIAQDHVARSLVPFIFHDRDYELMRSTGEFELVFTSVYSAKESFFKATYPIVRKHFGFECAAVTALDFESGTFDIQLVKDIGGNVPSGLTASGKIRSSGNHVATFIFIGRMDS